MRCRFVPLLCATMFLAECSSILAQSIEPEVSSGRPSVVALANVPLDLYALDKWKELQFDLYMVDPTKKRVEGVAITEREMRHVAVQKIVTQVKPEGITMRSYWIEPSLRRGGAVVTLHCRKDSLLSLERMEVQRDAKTFQVDVTDGEFELEFLQKSRTGRFPADTVTDAALLRIVSLLPRTPGVSYTLGHRTQTPEINVLSGKEFTVRCLGLESLTVGERVMECTKYDSGDMLFWVRNQDSLTVRMEIPGWKIMQLHE